MKMCLRMIVCAAGFWLIAASVCLSQEPTPADVNTPAVKEQDIDVVRLSSDARAMVERVLGKLLPLITERRQKSNLATLVFEELYAPLDEEEKAFIKRFQAIDPNLLELSIPYQGIPDKAPELVVIKGQKVIPAKGKAWTIPPQFLPKEVHEAYQAMMAAMKKDIGKTLYVESGYRSAAYQLYLFISYLKNHKYSIRETTRFSAWPGYSEHGWPEHQAIDFTNEQGVNGHYNTAAFEALQEYQWLVKNAARFGFELSYPKDSKMTYEPWHWRYNKMILDK